MKRVELALPELGLIAGTRAILGAGLGLLLSDRLKRNHRKTAGWTLLLLGAVSTIPLFMTVFCKEKGGRRPRS